MAKELDDVIRALPAERQANIHQEATHLITAEYHRHGRDLGLTAEQITQIEQAIQQKARWSVAQFDAAWRYDWSCAYASLVHGVDVETILARLERDMQAMKQARSVGEAVEW